MWGIGTVVLGQYRILDHLGGGTFGEVYRAEDTSGPDGMVALKQASASLVSLSPEDKEYVERARHEARMLKATSSPHVLRYIKDGVHDDYLVIVMELAGPTLGKLLETTPKGTPPVDEARARSIIIQALMGLSAAYRAACIAHRDIKPDNLFLSPSGLVKVGDFGISKLRDVPGLTRVHTFMGTYPYMAPECFVRPKTVDYHADVYALGVCLCRLLSGAFPLDVPGDMVDAMKVVTEESPTGPNDLLPGCCPPGLQELTLRLLAKNADERCSSLEGLIEELGGADAVTLICPYCYAAAGTSAKACPACKEPFAVTVSAPAVAPALAVGPATPAAPGARVKANLTVLRSDGKDAVIALDKDRVDLGRAELDPGNRYVSRLHARITRDADGWRVEDLASLNGTQVNAAFLAEGERRLLEDGDAVVFGDVMAHFVMSA